MNRRQPLFYCPHFTTYFPPPLVNFFMNRPHPMLRTVFELYQRSIFSSSGRKLVILALSVVIPTPRDDTMTESWSKVLVETVGHSLPNPESRRRSGSVSKYYDDGSIKPQFPMSPDAMCKPVANVRKTLDESEGNRVAPSYDDSLLHCDDCCGCISFFRR